MAQMVRTPVPSPEITQKVGTVASTYAVSVGEAETRGSLGFQDSQSSLCGKLQVSEKSCLKIHDGRCLGNDTWEMGLCMDVHHAHVHST